MGSETEKFEVHLHAAQVPAKIQARTLAAHVQILYLII